MCTLDECADAPSMMDQPSSLGPSSSAVGPLNAWDAAVGSSIPASASGGMSLFVPLGVLMGCILMAVATLVLWWMRRLQRQAHSQQQQETAVDLERASGPDSQQGVPHKIPILIMLPDSQTLALGWQVDCAQHGTHYQQPHAADCSWDSCGEEGQQGRHKAQPCAEGPTVAQAAVAAIASPEGASDTDADHLAFSSRSYPPHLLSVLTQAPGQQMLALTV
ncbi:hypothetical protein D9Q98_010325 [Chlorella vulgaris]|uniref:Uncharacterized protein n=1 Tax=Chlorella vulgaris TaxID=3077 RepID=A0A9D4TJW4_CHLVU|nr:hypothetical protein D9Q98_010325 [Chlorella vulgaris]